MKRLTGIIAAATIALAPLSASALEVMNDKAMNDVTAQAGVSIAIDDVILYQNVEETRYTDTDGIGALSDSLNDSPASIIIGEKTAVKVLNAIAPTNLVPTAMIGDLGASHEYNETDIDGTSIGANINVAGTAMWSASPLTIDIGHATLISIATDISDGSLDHDVDTAGVVIGLPTLEITTTSDTYSIGIAKSDADLDTTNTLIQVEKGASTLAILGGHVEIAPH